MAKFYTSKMPFGVEEAAKHLGITENYLRFCLRRNKVKKLGNNGRAWKWTSKVDMVKALAPLAPNRVAARQA